MSDSERDADLAKEFKLLAKIRELEASLTPKERFEMEMLDFDEEVATGAATGAGAGDSTEAAPADWRASKLCKFGAKCRGNCPFKHESDWRATKPCNHGAECRGGPLGNGRCPFKH